MRAQFSKWLRAFYYKITESIAFYPAIIAFGFLLLSWGMIAIDFSDFGRGIKSGWSWLSLKDASTARTIIATVAGAVISLTVFSFSMVMIVLNQAASQMSNRVLSGMIENRFQQVVLGIYIGTIVYALFLLSTIRDIASGVYVPALSVYLLIVLTVIDIFLFIYFLDYVTQTVKYETVIDRVRDNTTNSMKKNFGEIKEERMTWGNLPFVEIKVSDANYFQGFNEKKLLELASRENLYITFLFNRGTYLLNGLPFIRVYTNLQTDENILNEISTSTDLFSGQPIERNPDYGFNQLAEVAIKALSPGINDPGTAVIATYALADLLSRKLYQNLPELSVDNEKIARIFVPTTSFKDMFDKCIYPIWNYGKEDAYIQNALLKILEMLKVADHNNLYTELFNQLEVKVKKHIKARIEEY